MIQITTVIFTYLIILAQQAYNGKCIFLVPVQNACTKSYPLFIFQQDDNGSYACKRVMPNGQHRVKIEQHRQTNEQHRQTNGQHRQTNGQHRVKIEQHRPTNEQHHEETIIVETDSLGRTTATSSRNLKEFFSQASFEQAREHLKIM